MAITNLTNTKWIFVDNPDQSSFSSTTTFNINFITINYGKSYTTLKIDVTTYDKHIRFGDKLAYDDNDQLWLDDKAIKVTGGTDVTNTTLINWLQANATQVGELSQIQVGGTLYDIKDAYARDQIKNIEAGGVQYIGRTTTALTDGATTNPIIIGGASVTAKEGNLVIYNAGSASEHKDLEFIWNGEHWDELGSTGALGELAYLDPGDLKVTTDISHGHAFTTETVNATHSLVTSEVSANAHSYTPEGTIEVGSGTANYTPAGTVTLTPSDVSKRVTITGSTASGKDPDHTYTPAGTVTVTTGAPGSGETANYTPAGTISAPTFSGTEQTLSHSISGTVNVTGGTTSLTHNVTNHGTVKVDDHKFTPAGTINATFAGTQATLSHGSHTHTTTPSSSEKTLEHTVRQGTVTGTVTPTVTGAKYTPEGTVTSTFAGTQATLSHTVNTDGAVKASVSGEVLTLSAANITVNAHTYTPAGTVTSTFTGKEATIEPTVTATFTNGKTAGVAVADHKITTLDSVSVDATTIAAHTYTPAGGVSATFAGSEATLKHTAANTTDGTYANLSNAGIQIGAHSISHGSVNGAGFTIADHTFTPGGSVTAPTFSGSPTLIKAAFTGTQATISHSGHTHEKGTLAGSTTVKEYTASFTGTGVQLIFKGKAATLGHTVNQGTVTGTISYTKLKAITNYSDSKTGTVAKKA